MRNKSSRRSFTVSVVIHKSDTKADKDSLSIINKRVIQDLTNIVHFGIVFFDFSALINKQKLISARSA